MLQTLTHVLHTVQAASVGRAIERAADWPSTFPRRLHAVRSEPSSGMRAAAAALASWSSPFQHDSYSV